MNRLCSRNVSGHPSSTSRPKRFPDVNFGLWLSIVATLGTLLRLFRLGSRSFWLDEAISAMLARVDRHVFVAAVIHRQANMVLYYLLLRNWAWLGSNEFAIRGLSVVAGVAAIPAIYFLGAHLFGPRAGRVSAILLSIHAFHIRYSQEARAYSLSMLLAVLSSLFFLWSLERPSRKNWGAYVLASTLMLYAQVFGGWVLFAQWLSLFLRREVPWKSFLFSASIVCFLASPLAYCLLFVSDRTQLAWLTMPSLQDLYRFCLDMAGDGGPLLLFAYAGGIAAGISRRMSQSSFADTWKYWLLLMWLILPVALVLGISLRWPMFEPRFLIFCIPPLVLLASDALAQIRGRVLFVAALMILLGLSLSGTYSYYRSRADEAHSDDWRGATRHVLTQAKAGDAVLFSYSEERLAFDEYQWLLHMPSSQIHEFPEETESELLTRRPSRPSAEVLDNIIAGYRRVWVLSAYQPNRASREAEAVLNSHLSEHGDWSFGFVHANLFADRTGCLQEQLKGCH
jgi:mannosyltransferase